MPGTPLRPGQIYNSNYFTLYALLSNLCAEVIEMGMVQDDYEATRSVLMQAAEEADVIVSTGAFPLAKKIMLRLLLSLWVDWICGNWRLSRVSLSPAVRFAANSFLGCRATPFPPL